MSTLLCVPIFVRDVASALRDVALAGERGADMVELRIDSLTEADEVSELVRGSILPCIVTCRPLWEGGASALDDGHRIMLLQAALDTGASYVDVELKTLQHCPRASSLDPAKRIVSSHDFSGRPAGFSSLLIALNQTPAAVTKIVWTARTVRDNLEAFEILRRDLRPAISICMGEAGLLSRILAPKFNAFLSFASLDEKSGTAPGQVSIGDMRSLYRFSKIKSTTKVFGVVASPVRHSMSPAIHNAAFEAIGYDGVYVPFLVEGSFESFKAFIEEYAGDAALNLSGLSVTLPHKENALRYLQERGAQIEPLAERIGAVNTILIARDGDSLIYRGINTDYAAILDSITSHLSITRQDLANYRVAVIGAGGTGRTAVAALSHYGATVVIYNRTEERARELAAEFNRDGAKVVAAPIGKLCASCCQIYINTTSVGMFPNVDATPFGDQTPNFNSDTLVFDTIYNPMQTRLLREAIAMDAKTIGGVEMFVRQAVAQFEAWTNQKAPTDVMRHMVESRLQGIPR